MRGEQFRHVRFCCITIVVKTPMLTTTLTFPSSSPGLGWGRAILAGLRWAWCPAAGWFRDCSKSLIQSQTAMGTCSSPGGWQVGKAKTNFGAHSKPLLVPSLRIFIGQSSRHGGWRTCPPSMGRLCKVPGGHFMTGAEWRIGDNNTIDLADQRKGMPRDSESGKNSEKGLCGRNTQREERSQEWWCQRGSEILCRPLKKEFDLILTA